MPEFLNKTTKAITTRNCFTSFLFILPAVFIFCTFYVYPFIDLFKLSVLEWNGVDIINFKESFVGFRNFADLLFDRDFSEAWWGSVWHAGVITLVALTFQNALAFALAVACDREIRMKNFYRVVFFIPPVLSEVVVGLVWLWILNAGMQGGEHIGFLNYMLVKTGLTHLVNNWLSNPETALPCIAIVHSWKGFGWGFIMFLAGLQTIDKQLYEAAKIDGAGSWNILRNVTLPMMIPVILVVAILTILGSMQVFVLIISMTGSMGLVEYTSVPVTEILRSMYNHRFGYACAQGVTFGVILIAVSFAFKNIANRCRQA